MTNGGVIDINRDIAAARRMANKLQTHRWVAALVGCHQAPSWRRTPWFGYRRHRHFNLHSPRGRSADRIAAPWWAAGRAEWAVAADKLSGASSSLSAGAGAGAWPPTSPSQWLSCAVPWYPRLPFCCFRFLGNPGVPDWVGNLLVLGFVSFLGVLAQSSGVAASVAPQLACNYRTAGLRAVLHY